MALPEYVVRSFGGGAQPAQLIEQMGTTDTSFGITTTVGWTESVGANIGSALGTSGPFMVVIDRFTDTVEKILCSSVNLTTGLVTVDTSGGSGRGYDGSTPQGHVPNGSASGVQTGWAAEEAYEANQAVAYLLGTEGGTRTPGSLLSLNGSGEPAWETVAGLESISLFGVGTSLLGGTPPPRLTGVFYKQAGIQQIAFAGGGFLTFPVPFPNGVLSVVANVLDNATNTNSLCVTTSGTLSIWDLQFTQNGANYVGNAYVNYEATGW